MTKYKTFLHLQFFIFCCIIMPVWLHAQNTNPAAFKKIKTIRSKLQLLPLNDVKPLGWLQEEMQKNLNGFTGNLDLLVPDLIVNDDIYGKNRLTKHIKNKNVGAVSEDGDWQVQFLWWNSETQSNWLDGFMRTAVLLQDAQMLHKTEQIINRLLATQDPDGYIGIYDQELRYKFDNENGELWSKATLYRVLLGWYEYKKDKQILTAVEQAVANVMQAYPIEQSHPFYSVNPNAGGLTHGLVFTDVLEQLYAITKKQHYLDYCLFLYKDFSEQLLHEDAQYGKLLNRELPLKGHGVHTYEHLRSVIAAYYASGNPELKKVLKNFLTKIKKTVGPSGGPAGDEFILGRGADASLGYEFCSLHELMAGWVSLFAKSAASNYADDAEHLLFNAALGATHPVESAICYLKQDNAFFLTGGNNGDTTDKHQTRYRYSPVHKEAAVCCVPNAGRIFPYYVQHMWMKDQDGLAATLLGPCELSTTLKETNVTIKEETGYPFDNQLQFHITCSQPIDFSIKIRKPGWATNVKASQPFREKNGFLIFRRVWNGSTTLQISFTAELRKKEMPNKEVYFEKGPFILCRAIEGKQTVTKTWPFADLQESVYTPVGYLPLQYNGEEVLPVPGQQNSFVTKMINTSTRKTETVLLVPMARTILRQVSFKVKK